MYARSKRQDRIRTLILVSALVGVIITARLFSLQILQHGFYRALAEGQHSLYEQLFPERGKVFVTEYGSDELFPIVTNEPVHLVYANPDKMTDNRQMIARDIAEIIEVDEQVVFERISKEHDRYEPLKHAVREPERKRVESLGYVGIEFAEESVRYYPEGRIGSHLTGFLGYDRDKRRGQYGIEGAFDDLLAGRVGHLSAERDAGGRWIAIGPRSLVPAQDGDDLVLTIDRAIQHEACTKLSAAVERHGADGGSVVILEPTSGAILALCGAPDFDPNNYGTVEDPSIFPQPALFRQYEPGSVMKPLTMAAAVDQGKVTPTTTYVDTGQVELGKYTIKNSDGKAHGTRTMTQVLEESLNTGAIFAMRQIGPKSLYSHLQKFGFGGKTNIETGGEAAGDISALRGGGEIFAATASYGQGITATPLQLAMAYGALANRGQLMKPYVVKEIRHADGGKTVTQPAVVRQVVSASTATTVGAMMVNVVRHGHGKRAGVPGYYIAGKTGTAQVPKSDGPGYDPNATIGTFAGFGPVEKPAFVMVVRIDRPRGVQFAESTAAPLFGELADFILDYLRVPPTRIDSEE